MEWADAAEDLLSGPRGRRLCWSLLDAGDCPGWDRVWRGGMSGDLAGLTADLAARVAMTDLDAIAASPDELSLLGALAEPVATAMYWQEPVGDQALADPAVREVLLPVAQAVTAAPAARWWPAPVALDRQHYVEWVSEPRPPLPALTGTAAELAAWRSALAAEERSARERPDGPAANWSGHWWSTPRPSRLPSTTRSIPGLGAVGLALVEDPFDWREARCWPVEPRPGVRIYEISGPQRWAELVGRYPVDVTRSRRHDWWRVTHWAGTWLIPDFAAVASDYDAIHLSVAGYLTTAGRDVPVDEARTVLAGWGPDETYWLDDVLAAAGPASHWVLRDHEPVGWTLDRDNG